ncbi:GNAT family N-acetyltransferase [Amycolatopsis sp. CA-161197]|uniref:GNAT family N-acetyltransferase n=1 Tax=Amycolatopsis sp. CA-161197 TaxID=3239922 RepID=UPI003D8D20A6
MLTTRWVDPSDGSVAWQDDFQHILEAAEMQIDPMYRRYVAKDPIVFAFDCDAVVGVAQGHMVRHGFNERFGPFELLPVPQAMLDKVAVVPDAQGRGVGRLLVREFAAGMLSRGCTHVALMVDQSTPWEGRVKFFASCGFRSLIEGSDDDLLGAEITALRGVTAP